MTNTPERAIVDRVRALQKAGRTRVIIAIDGRCAAGKTTLAAGLAAALDAALLHMDEFFLRAEQRTEARLNAPGGNVDHERFRAEALAPLVRGEAFSYRPYSCKTGDFAAPVQVPQKSVSIVEGAYSLHPTLRDAYDIKVFLSVEPDEQLRRIRRRDGDEAASIFKTRWIPLEESYIERCGVMACADMAFLSHADAAWTHSQTGAR